MTEVFQSWEDFRKPSLIKCLKKQMTGCCFRYAPNSGAGQEKTGQYYCLRCGSHGEIIGDNIICLKCCNVSVKLNRRIKIPAVDSTAGEEN